MLHVTDMSHVCAIKSQSLHICHINAISITHTHHPYIYIYKGTRQKCRNVGSFNCNFSVTFMKSLNQSSIKPCQIHECHTYIT